MAFGGSLGSWAQKGAKAVVDPLRSTKKLYGEFGGGSGGGVNAGGNWWDQIGTAGPDDLTKSRIGELYRLHGESTKGVKIGAAKAQAINKQQIPLINKAADAASGNALKLAENTKRTVLDNQGSKLAESQQQLGGRGFGGSNLALLAERGVRGDTTRTLQSIDEFFANLSGQIERQRVGDVAGIYGQNANLSMRGAEEGAQLNSTLMQLISEMQQAPKKPSGFQQALGVAADAAPLLALL